MKWSFVGGVGGVVVAGACAAGVIYTNHQAEKEMNEYLVEYNKVSPFIVEAEGAKLNWFTKKMTIQGVSVVAKPDDESCEGVVATIDRVSGTELFESQLKEGESNVEIQGITIPITQNCIPNADQVITFLDGAKELRADARFSYTLDKEGNLSLSSFLDAQNIGKASVSIDLANMTETLDAATKVGNGEMSSDELDPSIILKIALRGFEFDFVDDGVKDSVLKRQAKEQGITVQELISKNKEAWVELKQYAGKSGDNKLVDAILTDGFEAIEKFWSGEDRINIKMTTQKPLNIMQAYVGVLQSVGTGQVPEALKGVEIDFRN